MHEIAEGYISRKLNGVSSTIMSFVKYETFALGKRDILCVFFSVAY